MMVVTVTVVVTDDGRHSDGGRKLQNKQRGAEEQKRSLHYRENDVVQYRTAKNKTPTLPQHD